MKVIKAEVMGFCAGVRRAVLAADEALKENKSGQVYTFGPLIHNPVALKDFESRGLKILSKENIPDVKANDTVVIRAHGVEPETIEQLEKTGAKVINGTCPLVQVNQKKVAGYASEGMQIIFTGDSNHGEVIGIEGFGRTEAIKVKKDFNFHLVKDPEELKKVISVLDKNKPVVMISQTTFNISLFEEMKQLLLSEIPEAQITKSICPATHERQDSLVKICGLADGIIVIGGKSSANTTRLFLTAQKLCKKAVLIENADEIPAEFFELDTVALTAGASTPDAVIEEVEKTLLSYTRN